MSLLQKWTVYHYNAANIIFFLSNLIIKQCVVTTNLLYLLIFHCNDHKLLYKEHSSLFIKHSPEAVVMFWSSGGKAQSLD